VSAALEKEVKTMVSTWGGDQSTHKKKLKAHQVAPKATSLASALGQVRPLSFSPPPATNESDPAACRGVNLPPHSHLHSILNVHTGHSHQGQALA
jgi:hypothetical protein